MVQLPFNSATDSSKADIGEVDEAPVTYKQMMAGIAANNAASQAKRAEIEARPGGLNSFRERAVFEPVVSARNHQIIEKYKSLEPGHPDRPSKRRYTESRAEIDSKVEEFYKPYLASFPIKAEQEARGGTRAPADEGFFGIVTNRNFDESLKEKHGAFREFLYIVRDPDTNEPIGGMNFAVYPPTDGKPLEGKYAGTVHSIYIFFDPEHRSIGLAKRLMDVQDTIAAAYLKQVVPDICAQSSAVLNFSEQNIPEQMTPSDYTRDSSAAVDQTVRLQKWYTLGYNKMDFSGLPYDAYVQPALEEGGDPCDVLSFNTYASSFDFQNAQPEMISRDRVSSISASTLLHHQMRFFSTSVVGDADAGNPENPDADPTTVDTYLKLKSMGDYPIPVHGYNAAMKNVKDMGDRIYDFLSSMTEAELMADKQISDLMDCRKNAKLLPEVKPSGLG